MLGLTSDVKIKVVSEEGCLHTLSVELPAAKVKEKIEAAFKDVQGQAKLPGFRPGKAPIEMVRENFKAAAYERAQDLLMREGVAKFKVPERVEIWDSLPKNDAGKVLKHQIRARLTKVDV